MCKTSCIDLSRRHFIASTISAVPSLVVSNATPFRGEIRLFAAYGVISQEPNLSQRLAAVMQQMLSFYYDRNCKPYLTWCQSFIRLRVVTVDVFSSAPAIERTCGRVSVVDRRKTAQYLQQRLRPHLVFLSTESIPHIAFASQ